MLQIRNILFPTDYSACAEQAFSQAAYLAERYEATLHVLHVSKPVALPPFLDLSEADIAADLHLPPPALMKQEDAEGLINVEMPPVDGSVDRAILHYAGAHNIDVIVMGTHGRHAVDRLLIGSVAGKVVRLADCPVFTVGLKANSPAKGGIQRILVPVDFSEHARMALGYATDLAETYGAKLDLLHVIEEATIPVVHGIEPALVHIPDLEQQAETALERLANEVVGPDVPVEAFVEFGYPARTIVDFAEQRGNDLIVIATHGLTGVKRLLLGSVAERVVHRAPCPAFTVKGFGKQLLASHGQAVTSESLPPLI